jgi:bifunctional pyridoxal-dependent enzyme with beta-cystathionase and maltose regulon repressor activities
VWSREELEGVAKLCLEHDVLVVSDEIHADLLMNGHVHIPFAALGEKIAQNCLVCTSASKTFSFAGLACANIIIPNADLRERFTAQRQKDGFGTDSIFGMRAMEAAYRDDSGWYEAMLNYVWGNYLYLKQFLSQHIPQAGLADLQGTYLAWADLSCLGLEPDQLMTFLRDEAALFLNDGRMFGEDRLLAACQNKDLL